ncbi:hypothetical protein MLD38_024391 [Melastoma candidum]|uniref:Uncharacterized protein n=1 Tax=Melastoma candidum TaxID=119954 RepID=A0ACB9NS83_9MYRT|nr:hypothetical protein MLD38_024391 [Melastoma candidum]
MPEYCVTGGTGFIAAYVVKSLLERGHTVRTTVRDPEDDSKVGFLKELNGAKERLKVYKADLLREGSFDEAVDGVDGVFHTASPVVVPYDNNVQATLIDPCIKGTQNVLGSCLKSATVKRVVLTYLLFLHTLWYAYAKTMAEKEAWRIAREKGPRSGVVNPSFFVGPLISPQPTSSLLLVLAVVKGLRGEYPNTTLGFVHIDDVVAAHVLAMEEKRASAKYPQYPYEKKCGSQKEMFDDCIKSFQEKGLL